MITKTTAATETCANCGRAIGQLETPHLWGEHVVCGECYGRLGAGFLAYSSPAIPPRTAPPVQTIEKTAKVWKIRMLIGGGIALAGCVMICAGFAFRSFSLVYPGIALDVIGLSILALAKIGAWWYHG